MKKLLVALLVLAVMMAAVGCFKHTFDVGKGAPNGKVVYDHWHSHWLFGIIGNKQVDVKEFCKSGDATIFEETSFVNGLIGAFIGLIYYPTTVEIRCNDGGKAQLNLSVEDMAKLVTDPQFLAYVQDVAPEQMDQAEKAVCNAEAFLRGETAVAAAF